MKPLIPRFEPARILIVGDVMLDRYWHGPTARISPEAPVPVVKVEAVEERPGGAANVAANIATLGGQVRVLGVAGADEAADKLEAKLRRSGVTAELIRLPGQATITKLRVLSRNQQLLRLDFEDGFPDLDPAALRERFAAGLAETDVVVLSDYRKGALRQADILIRLARAAGKPVLVDPKGDDWGKYAGATVMTPNRAELAGVVGRWHSETDMLQKAEKLRGELGLDALLVTRSEEGMSLLTDGHTYHQAALAREVYDVSGAGDTVIATLAVMLASGADLHAAMRLANRTAGIVVGKLGTAVVTRAELASAL